MGGYDKMGGGAAGGWHGWHVPGGRSWRALRDAAQLAVASQLADAADAADALDRASRGAGGGAEGGSGAGGGGASTSGSPLSRAGGGGGVGRIERVDARALRASIDAIVHAAAGIARATSRRDALRDAVGERLGSADETSREKSGDGGERTRSRPSLAALRGMLGDAKLDVAALRRRVEAQREDARDRAAANARRRESLVAGSKRLRAPASRSEKTPPPSPARGAAAGCTSSSARSWRGDGGSSPTSRGCFPSRPFVPAATTTEEEEREGEEPAGSRSAVGWSRAFPWISASRASPTEPARSPPPSATGCCPGARCRSRSRSAGRRRWGTSRRRCFSSRRCSTSRFDTPSPRARRGATYAICSRRGRLRTRGGTAGAVAVTGADRVRQTRVTRTRARTRNAR